MSSLFSACNIKCSIHIGRNCAKQVGCCTAACPSLHAPWTDCAYGPCFSTLGNLKSYVSIKASLFTSYYVRPQIGKIIPIVNYFLNSLKIAQILASKLLDTTKFLWEYKLNSYCDICIIHLNFLCVVFIFYVRIKFLTLGSVGFKEYFVLVLKEAAQVQLPVAERTLDLCMESMPILYFEEFDL